MFVCTEKGTLENSFTGDVREIDLCEVKFVSAKQYLFPWDKLHIPPDESSSVFSVRAFRPNNHDQWVALRGATGTFPPCNRSRVRCKSIPIELTRNERTARNRSTFPRSLTNCEGHGKFRVNCRLAPKLHTVAKLSRNSTVAPRPHSYRYFRGKSRMFAQCRELSIICIASRHAAPRKNEAPGEKKAFPRVTCVSNAKRRWFVKCPRGNTPVWCMRACAYVCVRDARPDNIWG